MFRFGPKCLIGIAFLAFASLKSNAQCLRIETILVDSCDSSGDEGFNEMFSFVVGPAPLYLSQMTVNWPSQAWQGLAQNATTASNVAALNTQIAALGGCGRLIEPSGSIPANADVIVITSYNFTPSANVFGALSHDVYILFQDNATVTAGHFGNYSAAAGIRTLTVGFGTSCSVSVSYDRTLLVDATGQPAAANGARVTYDAAGNANYGNLGCVAPVDVFSVDAGTVSAACSGASVSLNGTAEGQSSVTWSASVGSFSNPNALSTSFTLPLSASGTVTLTLTATNACGSSIQDTVTLNVTPGTVPTFSPPPAICYGETLTPLPTNSLNGISGGWSPAWDNTQTTPYTFTPNGGQCATSTQVTIVVNPIVIPGFTQVAAICPGQLLTPLPSISNNGISGSWSPALDNTQTTDYLFTPDGGQCATTATMRIIVSAAVIPTFNQVPPVCVGSTISALPTTSLEGITGSWQPALNNTQTTLYTFTPDPVQCSNQQVQMTITVTAANITPTFTPVSPICINQALSPLPLTSLEGITGTWQPALNNQSTTPYTFTPDAGQCATAASLNIIVNNEVIPTFTPVSAICSGDTLMPLPTTSNNGIAGSWSPALNNTQTTLYTFLPLVGQCATQTNLTITVNNAGTIPSFTQVAPICSGSILLPLPTTSNNGITGSWSPVLNNLATTRYTFTPNPGQCAVTNFMDIVVNNATVIPAFNSVSPICSGQFIAPLPTTSLNGISGSWSPPLSNTQSQLYTFTPTIGQCALTAQLSITVNNAIQPLFNALSPVCEGSPVTPLLSTSLNGITGTWSPAINNIQTTQYTFAPDAGQCALVAQLTQTITPKSTPSFATSLAICEGGRVPLLPNTSPNGITGSWSPAVIDNLGSGFYVFTPAPAECAISVNTLVTVNPNPIYFETRYICLDLGGQATAPSLLDTGLAAANYSFSWTKNGQFLPASSASYLSTSVGEFQVVATDNVTLCTITYLFTVIASPPATAEAYVNGEWENQQQIVVVASGGSGQFLYQLNAGPFQSGNIFVVSLGGDYVVNIKDVSGCSNFELPLTVLGYPRFFTPNDDGYNDTWNVQGLKSGLKGDITIFDRYGKLLKQFSAHGAGWDGTFNGKPLPSTDYWFVIEYQTPAGATRTYRAHFSLKR